jgi:predicted nucleotidyltransferase
MQKLRTSCYNGTVDGVAKETTMNGTKNFDRQTLEHALAELGRRALAAGRIVEIVVYGGSALLLTLNRQINTGDVDAVFEGNRHFVRKVAAEMAEEFGWDENWLNDGVKGWLSNRDSDPEVKALFKTYPSEDTPGLRVYTAKPEYLFAMKCRAMRIGGVETISDIDDIRLLARAIGIRNSRDALTLVEKFYPESMLQLKTRLGLQEIFSTLDPGSGDDDSSQP